MTTTEIAPDATTRLKPESIRASVNYLEKTDEAPWADIFDQSKGHMPKLAVDVTVANGWHLLDTLSLDDQGFTVVKSPTAVTDFHDPAELIGKYAREMEELVVRLTGAARAIVTEQPVTRWTGVKTEHQPGLAAHTDYIPETVPARLRSGGIDLDSPEFSRYRRFGIYQAWRALSGPGQDTPLAVTHGRSVPESDMIETSLVGQPDKIDPSKDTVSEELGNFNKFYSVQPNPQHKWYYFPRMELDEVLVWKGLDMEDLDMRVVHSAILDPTETEAPPRNSVETRIYAFFD